MFLSVRRIQVRILLDTLSLIMEMGLLSQMETQKMKSL